MLSAVILINVSRGSTNTVAQSIIGIEGIKHVFSVAGRFDLVAIAQAHSMEELSKISNDEFDQVTDITSVETLISMKVFPEETLDQMFSVGFQKDQ